MPNIQDMTPLITTILKDRSDFFVVKYGGVL